ncbi:MAG: T9SS type A sorting domain-containing protein, partial [Flavobacteriales bacterium]
IYTVVLIVQDSLGCTATDTIWVDYGTVGLTEFSSDAVSVLPNPSHGVFTLRLQNTASPVQGWLMDGTGRMVLNGMPLHSGDNTVDITGLADGPYILRLRIGEELRHLRILKQ